MSIAKIHLEIAKEKACIDDLLKVISMHTQDNQLELAAARGRDMLASVERIRKLEEKKRLYLVAFQVVSRIAKS